MQIRCQFLSEISLLVLLSVHVLLLVCHAGTNFILQLYDLYTGRFSKGENHVNSCPDEDQVCLHSLEGRRCGTHGICELTDAFNKQYKCTCKPGYRTAGSGKENCEISK